MPGAQLFYTRFKSGITTTAEFLTDARGKTSIQNTGVTTLTIGSTRENTVDGEGMVLEQATAAGDGDGDIVEFNTIGPMYIISSASGGRCTIISE